MIRLVALNVLAALLTAIFVLYARELYYMSRDSIILLATVGVYAIALLGVRTALWAWTALTSAPR